MKHILSNRYNYIISYGLFLGYVLSFIYSGPILNLIKQDNSLYILTIFLAAIFSSLVTYYSKIKVTKTKMLLSLFVNVFASTVLFISLYYFKNITTSIFILPLLFLVGSTAMFISNCFLSISKNHSSYESIYITVALIMLVANLLSYVVYLLISAKQISIAFTIIVICVFLVIKYIGNCEVNRANLQVCKHSISKNLFFLAFLIFCLKISEGIIYSIIESNFADQSSNYELYYILPYIIALMFAAFLARYKKGNLYSVISICISLTGIGMLIILINPSFIVLTNIILHFSLGFLDIIIWAGIIYLIYVYDNGLKISSFIMFFHMAGVLFGSIISQLYYTNKVVVYFTALISIFIAFIFNTIVINIKDDISERKKEINAELEKQKGLESRESYNLLSKREKEVLQQILKGRINRDIANELKISETTVKTHCKNIYIKIGVKNKKELRELFND